MIEKSYATRMNNQRSASVMVYELDSELVLLQPGQSFEVESRSNMTLYARWSSVTWHEGGKVTFVTRSNWTEPDRGKWLLRLFNQDGDAVERRVVGGRPIILPKCVPVLIGLMLNDPLIKSKSLTIVKRRVMTMDEEHEGYCLHVWTTTDELEKREPSELKALEKLQAEKGHVG